MKNNYYNRIQELRWENDMSQAQLARLSGVKRSTIQTIENGLSVPSVTTAIKLAHALSSSVEEIFII